MSFVGRENGDFVASSARLRKRLTLHLSKMRTRLLYRIKLRHSMETCVADDPSNVSLTINRLLLPSPCTEPACGD